MDNCLTRTILWVGLAVAIGAFAVLLLVALHTSHPKVAGLRKQHREEAEQLVVLCKNIGGGIGRYLNELAAATSRRVTMVKSLKQWNRLKLNHNTIILAQCFEDSDLGILEFLRDPRIKGVRVVVPIHEWKFFTRGRAKNSQNDAYNQFSAYLDENASSTAVPLASQALLERADVILSPSNFVNTHLARFGVPMHKVKRAVPFDYSLATIQPTVPVVLQGEVRIAALTSLSECKGSELLRDVVSTFDDTVLHGVRVSVLLVGKNEKIPPYKEGLSSFLRVIEKHKINGLLHLNKWGETYCYALTKSIISGLPILYNGVGSFPERLAGVSNAFVAIDNEGDYTNFGLVRSAFSRFVKHIAKTPLKWSGVQPDPPVVDQNMILHTLGDRQSLKFDCASSAASGALLDRMIEGKRVACIGKAGELSNHNYSNVLASCDVIVRANARVILNDRIKLDNSIIKNTNARTDIVYSSGSLPGEVIRGTGLKNEMVSKQDGLSAGLVRAYERSGVRVVVIAEPSRQKNGKLLRKNLMPSTSLSKETTTSNLTTGTKMVLDILNRRPASVFVCGIDCMLSASTPMYHDMSQLSKEPTMVNGKIGTHNPKQDLFALYTAYKQNPRVMQPSNHLRDTWGSFAEEFERAAVLKEL
tara:strand:- start:50183 stop:52111 length:1929 start_codon:yes stop_codon:yes gene_type:complete